MGDNVNSVCFVGDNVNSVRCVGDNVNSGCLFRGYVNSGGLVKHRETLKNKLVKNRLKGEVTLRCLLDQIFRGTDDSLNRMHSHSMLRLNESLERAHAEMWSHSNILMIQGICIHQVNPRCIQR
jgi:hypothetical protein